MTDPEKLLFAYEVDVDFPDVSGMEHLQMLMRRSDLYRMEPRLSAAQKKRLAAADRKLLQQSDRFYAAIQSIADLEAWRRDENITPQHWWWYLDVLAHLPAGAIVSAAPAVVA